MNGADVASYQKGIKPKNMTTTDFIITKFTQGTWYVNPYRESQYGDSEAAGKLLGAYHYAEGGSAVAEARFFVKDVGDRIGNCILALDWEGRNNPTFGSGKDVQWCYDFCAEVERLTGVKCFVYMSKSVCRKYNWSKVAEKYPLWCAQYASSNKTNYQNNPWTDKYGFGKWDSDTIRQYSSHGSIAGYSGNIDINLAYLTENEWTALAKGSSVMNMPTYSRAEVVNLAKSKIGIKEGSAAHHAIIDTYNANTPLPRGYAVKYTDAWCATFVSYIALTLGYTDIIPVECGCPQMITLAKSMEEWVEDDNYTPNPGDIILYDWQDGTGSNSDNTGNPDHIGVITEVNGSDFKVVEGNYHDAVDVRNMTVNGRYIRGYIVPKYTADDAITDDVHMVKWTGYTKVQTKAYMQPSTKSAVCSFSPIPKDAQVGICKGEGKFYLVKYGAKFGYVHKSHIRK